MRSTWIGLGCAAVMAGGCSSGDKPKVRPDDVATSARTTMTDAATAVPLVTDAAPVGEPLAQLPGFRFVARADVADPELVAKVTADLEPLAEGCDEDTAQLHVLHVNLDDTRPGVETVAASLPYGVFALGGDQLIARSLEPVAPCEGSQTELIGLWAGQAVVDPEPELVVIDQFGGRNLGRTTLWIFKRHGSVLAPIFTAALAEYEGDVETTRAVALAADGTISAETGDGKIVYRFDSTAAKFIAVGPP